MLKTWHTYTQRITLFKCLTQVIKNGSIHTGKQKYACKACEHQLVDDPQWRVISDDTKALIDRLLRERLSLTGIARAGQVSESGSQAYVIVGVAIGIRDEPTDRQFWQSLPPVYRQCALSLC